MHGPRTVRSGLRQGAHRLLVPLLVVLFCLPLAADERMVSLHKPDLAQPADGYALGEVTTCGDWTAWAEYRVVDPRMHAPRYDVRLSRQRAGRGDPEQAWVGHDRGSSVLLSLAEDGSIVFADAAGLHVLPEEGGPKEFAWPVQALPLAVFADGCLADTGDWRTGPHLSFVRTGPDAAGLEVVPLAAGGIDLLPGGPYREGDLVAWVCGGTASSEPDVCIADLRTRQVRDVMTHVPGTALDGLRQGWLLCHDILPVARFIPVGGGAELRLPAPAPIRAVLPQGIVYNEGLAYDLWDPVTGARRRFACGDGDDTRFCSVEAGHGSTRICLTSGRFPTRALGWFAPEEGMVPVPPEMLSQAKEAEAALRRVIGTTGKVRASSQDVWEALLKIQWPYAPGTVDDLARILAQFPDFNARRMAAFRLGRSTEPEARETLLEAFETESAVPMEVGIVTALAHVCGKRDVPRIVRVLEDRPPLWAAEEAPQALAVLGNPCALPYLQMLLETPIPHPEQRKKVRDAAQEAIALLGMRPDVEDLLSRLRR